MVIKRECSERSSAEVSGAEVSGAELKECTAIDRSRLGQVHLYLSYPCTLAPEGTVSGKCENATIAMATSTTTPNSRHYKMSFEL